MKKLYLAIALICYIKAGGITNTQTILPVQGSKTNSLIEQKETQTLQELEEYKKSLLKKQKALSNNLEMLFGIEALLKKQLYIRHKLIKNTNK